MTEKTTPSEQIGQSPINYSPPIYNLVSEADLFRDGEERDAKYWKYYRIWLKLKDTKAICFRDWYKEHKNHHYPHIEEEK